jgi:hypothetical protein
MTLAQRLAVSLLLPQMPVLPKAVDVPAAVDNQRATCRQIRVPEKVTRSNTRLNTKAPRPRTRGPSWHHARFAQVCDTMVRLQEAINFLVGQPAQRKEQLHTKEKNKPNPTLRAPRTSAKVPRREDVRHW